MERRCSANAARSQMAEGLARALLPETVRIASAGSSPGQLDPRAVAVLAEQGIDIQHHHSKSVDGIRLADFDQMVTLCADEVCPLAMGDFTRHHWPFPDPAGDSAGPDDLAPFRAVRDALRERISETFA
ncbi:arsenate reductase ArsC [Natronospira sp.]|uniref:arsenate reductase ArsC n=1 Tax=Natronospira sp. TaxID=2024970 RepID=UPI00387322D5